MIVSAYKCAATGELFEDEKKYKSHLRRMRYASNKERKRLFIINSFNEWLAAEKENINSVDMIAPWILENQRKLMDAVNTGLLTGDFSMFSIGEKFYDTDELTDLSFKNINYKDRVSNTHDCPHNGVTNFFCKNNLPQGYPGYRGQLEGRLKREKKYMSEYPFSNILNLVRVLTGSGGGGNAHFGWEVSIFLDDWPGIREGIVFNKLKYGSDKPGSYNG